MHLWGSLRENWVHTPTNKHQHDQHLDYAYPKFLNRKVPLCENETMDCVAILKNETQCIVEKIETLIVGFIH